MKTRINPTSVVPSPGRTVIFDLKKYYLTKQCSGNKIYNFFHSNLGIIVSKTTFILDLKKVFNYNKFDT